MWSNGHHYMLYTMKSVPFFKYAETRTHWPFNPHRSLVCLAVLNINGIICEISISSIGYSSLPAWSKNKPTIGSSSKLLACDLGGLCF